MLYIYIYEYVLSSKERNVKYSHKTFAIAYRSWTAWSFPIFHIFLTVRAPCRFPRPHALRQ